MTFRACDLNLGAKTGPRSGAASLRRRRAQADGSENTLRDADVQLHADAVSGLRSLIEQPTLLAAFLAHARAPPRRTSPAHLRPARRGPCAQGRWRESTKLPASDWAGVHWVYDTLIALLSGAFVDFCGLLWTRAGAPCLLALRAGEGLRIGAPLSALARTRAAARRMLLDGLLCARHEDVRAAAAALLQRVRASPSGHVWALGVLREGMAAADAQPAHCGVYYRAFAEAVAAIREMPVEVRARVRVRAPAGCSGHARCQGGARAAWPGPGARQTVAGARTRRHARRPAGRVSACVSHWPASAHR